MNALLHVAALAPALLAVAIVCASPRTAGRAERAAAVVMLIGMVDAMLLSIVAPAIWFVVLIAVAISLAAGRRFHLSADARRREENAAGLSTQISLGLIVTAVLLLFMPTVSTSASQSAAPTDAAHHGAAAPLALVCAALVAGSVAMAAAAIHADRRWRHRLHHVAMAGSTVAMGAVLLA